MKRYYTRLREPGPGAIPGGAVEVQYFGKRKYIPEVNCMAWGYAEYTDPLPEAMVESYELEPARDLLEEAEE